MANKQAAYAFCTLLCAPLKHIFHGILDEKPTQMPLWLIRKLPSNNTKSLHNTSKHTTYSARYLG